MTKLWHRLFHKDPRPYGMGCTYCDRVRAEMALEATDPATVAAALRQYARPNGPRAWEKW